ncbi:MAG: hypothetical protein Q8P67_25545 [archaeon]|nr:hypothetical protein [archaeon]
MLTNTTNMTSPFMVRLLFCFPLLIFVSLVGCLFQKKKEEEEEEEEEEKG